MNKFTPEDLILYQREELDSKKYQEIKKALKKDTTLREHLNDLNKADNYFEQYFNDLAIPNNFKKQISNKTKKKINFSSIFDFKFFYSYGSGLITACFVFMIIITSDYKYYSNESLLEIERLENVTRDVTSKQNNYLYQKQNKWLQKKDIFFQFIKLDSLQNKEILVEENQYLNVGKKVIFKILSSKDLKLTIYTVNQKKPETKNLIVKNTLITKGIETTFPNALNEGLTYYEITKPKGRETLVFEANNEVIFKFKSSIK